MGRYVKIKNEKTLQKVERARALNKKGMTISEIAFAMSLSESRIRELIRGVNWNSFL